MNDKKNIVMIIVLSILVLGLGGYIIFDKTCKTKDTKPNETEIKEIEEKNTTEENKCDCKEEYNKSELISIVDNFFPNKNDSKVTGKDVYKEFKNGFSKKTVTFYYNNYKFIYDYLDGSADSSKIEIYNKNNNKLLYFNSYVKTVLDLDSDPEIYKVPTISDNKLHFLAYNPNNCYQKDEELSPYLEYIQLDLSSDKMTPKTMVSIKGVEFGEAPHCKE